MDDIEERALAEAQEAMSVAGPCALCGGTVGVGFFTPDMDISPVPLCRLCLFTRVLSPPSEYRS